MDYKILFEKALEVSKNAWCVYSDFPVGAVLLLDDDSMVFGVNVENRS